MSNPQMIPDEILPVNDCETFETEKDNLDPNTANETFKDGLKSNENISNFNKLTNLDERDTLDNRSQLELELAKWNHVYWRKGDSKVSVLN